MALSAKVGTFQIDTSVTATNNQPAVTGVGFTPTAIIFWWSGSTSATTAVAGQDVQAGIGFTTGTGTLNVCSLVTLDDAADPTQTQRRQDANQCIVVMDLATNAITGAASLASFDADGFTLITNDQFPDAIQIHYLAIGGTTSAKAGGFLCGTGTGTADITDPGFNPDVLFLLSTTATDTADAATSGAMVAFSVAVKNSGIWTTAFQALDNQATSVSGSHGFGEYACTMSGSSDKSVLTRFTISDWTTANGFTINKAETAASFAFQYLALAGGSWLAGDSLTRTDGNDINTAALSFTPVGVLVASHCQAESSSDTGQDNASLAIGAATGTSARVGSAIYSADGAAAEVCGVSVLYEGILTKPDLADGVAAAMDIKTWADPITFVMDDTEPSAGSFFGYVAFGNAVTGGGNRALVGPGPLLENLVGSGPLVQA